MADRLVRAILTADNAQALRGFEETAGAADATSDAISDSFTKSSSKVGGIFERLGKKLETFGLPGGKALEKFGSKLDETSSKSQKFGQVFSAVGGAALVGGVAGVAAFGAESVEMADKFDTAQANLKVAIKSTGDSFKQWQGPIKTTYGKMQALGFNATDTAQALTNLVTASGTTATSLNLMGQAANLARFKHISLATATQLMAKVMGGSNRALTQMGINLDIGSAKLSSIRTATQSVAKDQLALKTTQDKIADGAIKAATASDALAAAQQNLHDAQTKLKRDQGTMAKVLDTLTKKTHGAAAAYGQTLAGQMDVAKAAVDNLGIKFGEFLIPKIQDAVKIVEKIVDWFTKHKKVAEALAIAVGTVLAAAIVKFSVETAGKATAAAGRFSKSLLHLGTTFKSAAGASNEETDATKLQSEKVEILQDQVKILSAKLALLKDANTDATKSEAELTQKTLDATKGQLSMEKATLKAVKAQQELAAAGPKADESLQSLQAELEQVTSAAAEMGSALPEAGEGLDAMSASTDAAATSATGMGTALKGALGGTGVGLVITAATLIATHWKLTERILKDAWHDIERAADWVWKHIDEAWHKVLEVSKSVWGILLDFYVKIPEKIISVFASAGKWLLKGGKDILHGLWSGMVKGFDLVEEFEVKLPLKILEKVASAGKWLIHIGIDVMKGLLHGIEDGLKDVLHGIEDAGSSIVGGFKSALSIFSPSKKTHELGKNLMEGLALGISDNAKLANGAMAKVASKLATAPFKAPPVAIPASAFGGGTSLPAGIGGFHPALAGALGATSKTVINNLAVSSPASASRIASEVAWATKTLGE